MHTPNPSFKGFELIGRQNKSSQPLSIPPAFFEEVLINEPLSCVRVVWYVLERTLNGEELVTASYSDLEKALHLSHSSVCDGLRRALEGGYIRQLRSGENGHLKAQYTLVRTPDDGGNTDPDGGGGTEGDEGTNNPHPTGTLTPNNNDEEVEASVEESQEEEPLPFGSSQTILQGECSTFSDSCIEDAEASTHQQGEEEVLLSLATPFTSHPPIPTHISLKSYQSNFPTATITSSTSLLESRIDLEIESSSRSRIAATASTPLASPACRHQRSLHHGAPNRREEESRGSSRSSNSRPIAKATPHHSPTPVSPKESVLTTTTLPLTPATVAPISPGPTPTTPPTALPAYLASLSKRLSIELGDARHTTSNRTQTERLFVASGLSQKEFARLLYQARDLTSRYALPREVEVPPAANGGGVRNTMAYFFVVVRDLLGRWGRERKEVKAREARGELRDRNSYERVNTSHTQSEGTADRSYPGPRSAASPTYTSTSRSSKAGDKFAGWKKFLGVSGELEPAY